MGILRKFREWRERRDGTLDGPQLTIGGQDLTITEDSGDFVAEDGSGNVVLRYDSAAGRWVMDSLSTGEASVVSEPQEANHVARKEDVDSASGYGK